MINPKEPGKKLNTSWLVFLIFVPIAWMYVMDKLRIWRKGLLMIGATYLFSILGAIMLPFPYYLLIAFIPHIVFIYILIKDCRAWNKSLVENP